MDGLILKNMLEKYSGYVGDLDEGFKKLITALQEHIDTLDTQVKAGMPFEETSNEFKQLYKEVLQLREKAFSALYKQFRAEEEFWHSVEEAESSK